MTVRFYAAADGEVLSNEVWPVKAKFLLMDLRGGHGRATYAESVSESALRECVPPLKLYHSVTIRLPEESWRVDEEGTIR